MNGQFSDWLCDNLEERQIGCNTESKVTMKKKRLPDEKGQVLIFVTLAFVILGMFLGLAVDGGRAFLMRERLRSIVDAAALAGAKAMAGPTDLEVAKENARLAACDSAKVNGLDAGVCDSTKLKVEIGPVPVSGELGVIVTGTDTSRTFFMALGGFIGCESCRTIDVKHVGVAVPDTLADVVLVLDDTGTMKCVPGEDCPITNAKLGAQKLIDMLLADPSSHAKIAFVPFRGCYAPDRMTPAPLVPFFTPDKGCIKPDEMQDLTNDAAALAAKINTRQGAGGFPGTNICVAMIEGRKKLFGPESRAIARKVMVILTDGENNYSDSAEGPQPNPPAAPVIPNLGTPTPHPYPLVPYDPTTGLGDKGTDSSPSCMPTQSPGHPTLRWGDDAANFDPAINQLDIRTNQYASTLKDPNGDKTEIYILRFSNPNDDTLTSGDPPGSCDPALVGAPGVHRGGVNGIPGNTDDIREKNLSRCLASNTAMGDPFAVTANDHYFFATTAADINTKFQAIATNILRKRRLVA
jgi:Putative Flp pilus-assembly TadE/G-like